MMAFCPEHPKWDQNPKFTILRETTSIPTLLQVCHPNRNLRHVSTSRGLSWSLVVPTHQTQAYSRCSLFLCSYTYSQKFDSFPVDIKNAQTLFLFKRKLKTFLFNQFLTFVKRAEIMQLRYYYYYYYYYYYCYYYYYYYYYYYCYYHHEI